MVATVTNDDDKEGECEFELEGETRAELAWSATLQHIDCILTQQPNVCVLPLCESERAKVRFNIRGEGCSGRKISSQWLF